MAATQYGFKFIFGIPTQEELLAIQNCLMADHIVLSNRDFLKIARDGRHYAVECIGNGYSAFLLDE
jgi:hypothetical protein